MIHVTRFFIKPFPRVFYPYDNLLLDNKLNFVYNSNVINKQLNNFNMKNYLENNKKTQNIQNQLDALNKSRTSNIGDIVFILEKSKNGKVKIIETKIIAKIKHELYNRYTYKVSGYDLILNSKSFYTSRAKLIKNAKVTTNLGSVISLAENLELLAN